MYACMQGMHVRMYVCVCACVCVCVCVCVCMLGGRGLKCSWIHSVVWEWHKFSVSVSVVVIVLLIWMWLFYSSGLWRFVMDVVLVTKTWLNYFSLYCIYILTVLDRALMIGGKKNCKTPESLKRCPHSVCLSVRLLVNGLQDTPFDLSTYAIFSMNKSSIVIHK